MCTRSPPIFSIHWGRGCADCGVVWRCGGVCGAVAVGGLNCLSAATFLRRDVSPLGAAPLGTAGAQMRPAAALGAGILTATAVTAAGHSAADQAAATAVQRANGILPDTVPELQGLAMQALRTTFSCRVKLLLGVATADKEEVHVAHFSGHQQMCLRCIYPARQRIFSGMGCIMDFRMNCKLDRRAYLSLFLTCLCCSALLMPEASTRACRLHGLTDGVFLVNSAGSGGWTDPS